MSSVNKVTILGSLGADPETRSLGNSGGKVVNLRVATSESWKDKNTGEKQEKTEWHQIVIFNEGLGGIAEKYLKKGSQVYLEGQLQTRSWEDQSGQKKYSTEIVLQRYRGELVLLGGKTDTASQPDQSTAQSYTNTQSGERAPAAAQSFANDMDDSIPF